MILIIHYFKCDVVGMWKATRGKLRSDTVIFEKRTLFHGYMLASLRVICVHGVSLYGLSPFKFVEI